MSWPPFGQVGIELDWIFRFCKSDPVIQTACQKEAYPESFINLGQPGPKVVMTFHSVCMYLSLFLIHDLQITNLEK